MEPQSNQSLALADQTVDMFSERGFQLAQRVGKAFATSDAVPAAFRSQVLKKAKDAQGNWVEEWVENPAALGNCLIAIETARAVRMSITAVMQNANVIENRLTWSGKFVIAAINASGRFTPLRFQVRNLGVIKAKYREKQGYNRQKGGYDFKETEVEIENLECIAWALPGGMRIPSNIRTLEQAQAADLPTIESAPVSMKLAVEEGWYGKPGSKWQTELKHLMLQYRAGSFFGNIHAPDIVMGMGRSTEEEQDLGEWIDMDTGEIGGQPAPKSKPAVRTPTAKAAPVEVVEQAAAEESEQGASNEDEKPEAGAEQAAAAPAAAAPAATESVAPPAPPAPPAPAAPPAPPAAAAPTAGAPATDGERQMIIKRAKNNNLDLRELLRQAGLADLPDDLAGLTKDGFVALKDLLPKAA